MPKGKRGQPELRDLFFGEKWEEKDWSREGMAQIPQIQNERQ
jgi:hypothetical protein